MKTLLQITAQYYENYGAHSWDGQGECPQRWKAKGGQMFTLRVDSDYFMYAEEQCVKAIAILLEKQSNEYVRYTYIDHELIFCEPIILDDAEFEKELETECEKAFR